MSQVVVIVGGASLAPASIAAIDRGALIIAADSGLDHARAAGLRPDLLVGDMDSISDDGFLWARAQGVTVDAHPRDKNLTDTAIAIGHARASGRAELLLLGGAGDRLDHTLGTVATLGAAENSCFTAIEAHLGTTRLYVVFPGRCLALDGERGTGFSLLTLHGDCHDVTVEGARWPLDHAVLAAGSTRGISNETDQDTTVCVGLTPSPNNPLTVVYS